MTISWFSALCLVSCICFCHFDINLNLAFFMFFQLVTWTISSLQPWVVLPAACGSQASWTLTSGSLQSTWYPSLASISSWLALHHWHQGDPSSTVPSPSPSWPSRCGMPRTWCAQLTHDTGATWQHQPCSAGRWAPRRWTSRCWMCRTRTSWSGSRTTWIVNLIFLAEKWFVEAVCEGNLAVSIV